MHIVHIAQVEKVFIEIEFLWSNAHQFCGAHQGRRERVAAVGGMGQTTPTVRLRGPPPPPTCSDCHPIARSCFWCHSAARGDVEVWWDIPNCSTLAPVAQWQSICLRNRRLWVRVPSGVRWLECHFTISPINWPWCEMNGVPFHNFSNQLTVAHCTERCTVWMCHSCCYLHVWAHQHSQQNMLSQ